MKLIWWVMVPVVAVVAIPVFFLCLPWELWDRCREGRRP
jgi:hypothetical protein